MVDFLSILSRETTLLFVFMHKKALPKRYLFKKKMPGPH